MRSSLLCDVLAMLTALRCLCEPCVCVTVCVCDRVTVCVCVCVTVCVCVYVCMCV